MCSLNVQTNPYVPSGFYSPCGMVGCQKTKDRSIGGPVPFQKPYFVENSLTDWWLEHDFF